MSPLTVALATYNRSGYLAKTIPTILGQTFNDFELIVLDNASTDDTEAVIESFDDPRIRYVRHAANIGGYQNLNTAMEIARSEFLIILHDDDLLEPQLFEREIETLRADPALAMVTCNGHLIDADGQVTAANVLGLPTRDFLPLEYCEAYIVHGKNLFLPAHMYRTSRLRELGLRFRAMAGNGADALFVNELNLTERFRFLDEPLFRYRVHGGQWCRQLHDSLRAGFLLWTAFRQMALESGRLDHLLPPLLSKLRDCFGFYFLTFCFSETMESARIGEFMAATLHLPQPILAELALDPKFRLLMEVCGATAAWPASNSESYQWSDLNWVRNQRAFEAWENVRANGRTLSQRLVLAGIRRVAVFGATLIGYLMTRDLEENGIEVVAILENRRENIGLHFCGHLVHSPEWMQENGGEVNGVITACFSAADLAIGEELRKCRFAAPGWVASWRDLLLLECPALILGESSEPETAVAKYLKVA